MNTKLEIIAVAALILNIAQYHAHSQGTFVNLDFEHPIQPLNPVNGLVPISKALPGWTGYIGGIQQTQVVYNTVSGGDPAISLQGSGSFEPILQGTYTAGLQGSSFGTPGSAAIGQTGQVPTNSESLQFFGAQLGNIQVSFGGQLLPFYTIGSGPNYTVYGADITAFAGQTGQLLFTALPNGGALIDNIQFSPNPVPEPGTWALMLCGAGVFAFRRCKRKR